MEYKKIKNQGIIKRLSINYNEKSGTYWNNAEVYINGYIIKLESKWDFKTLDEAVIDIKKRIVKVVLDFDKK